MPPKATPPEIRFWWHVVKKGPDECWIWLASAYWDGYGQFSEKFGKAVRAHRFSWELHNGPIPEGLFVCHKCDTPLCVNPNHLFLGTHLQNMDDARKKNRLHGPFKQNEEANV